MRKTLHTQCVDTAEKERMNSCKNTAIFAPGRKRPRVKSINKIKKIGSEEHREKK